MHMESCAIHEHCVGRPNLHSTSSTSQHALRQAKLVQDGNDGAYTLHYNNYKDGTSKVGAPATLEVDVVIGADGANSRVAKEIDAGDYDYAIAFQVAPSLPALDPLAIP